MAVTTNAALLGHGDPENVIARATMCSKAETHLIERAMADYDAGQTSWSRRPRWNLELVADTDRTMLRVFFSPNALPYSYPRLVFMR